MRSENTFKDQDDQAVGLGGRRLWSREEKWLFFLERQEPGVSDHDISERYGIPVYLLRRWYRQVLSGAFGTCPEHLLAGNQSEPSDEGAVCEADCGFISLGVLDPPDLVGAEDSQQEQAGFPASGFTSLPKPPPLAECSGVIEIDLPHGVCVRVDAFVNAKALQRVLVALKDFSGSALP